MCTEHRECGVCIGGACMLWQPPVHNTKHIYSGTTRDKAYLRLYCTV